MYCIKNITDDLFWVGGSDRRLAMFENAHPIPRGISYNSYVLLDEKTVLFDTIDRAVSDLFLENIEAALGCRSLDYIVVNHMEPDHCATLGEVVRRYPEVKIIGNVKTMNIINQFYDFGTDGKAIVIKEGDTFSSGKHTFTFFMAPMVHWPEVMMTYDTTDKVLFSADAFGTFGAMNGNLFADELNFERDWLDESRRYYSNIVGKYGSSTQTILKKISGLDIKILCPLHGPMWRSNIGWYMDKYNTWSSYEPEEKAVMIAYGSIYGNTENAANILACRLSERGVRNIVMYDVSVTHPSYILSEAFRCSHLVFASSTYNGEIFSYMDHLLREMKNHNVQNRTVALMENGSWALMAGKKMTEIISGMKNMTILDGMVTIKSAVKEDQLVDISALAASIADSLFKE